MSEKDNNVMPLATDPHNLGEFDNVYDAMRRYPNGGVDGDYIYILGVQHFWNVNRQSWGILKDKEDNLVQMVEDFIGLFERRGYVFAGYALPDTTPVSGLDNIFYIAAKNGVYTHFGSDLKLLNEVAILRKPRRSSIWIKDSMDIPNSERIDAIDDAISRINVDIKTIKSAIIGMENDLDGVHDSIDDINKDIGAFKKETSENFEEVNSDLDKVEKRLDYIPKESFLSARPAGFKPDIDLTPEIMVDRAWRDHEGNVIRDTYITRRGLRNEIIDITNQQVTDLKPGSVDPDDLSEATKQLIGNKSVTNLPDEEDITVTDNQTLKLKDKEYAPKDYSGMGRVYLRKHYVNGVNTLTQHMMRKPNTIYIIQYDYCLAGQTIEVPENCVLDFQGGSLRNGVLTGNYTELNLSYGNFSDINFRGSFNSKSTILPIMFNGTDDDIFRDMSSLSYCGVFNIVIPYKSYALKNIHVFKTGLISKDDGVYSGKTPLYSHVQDFAKYDKPILVPCGNFKFSHLGFTTSYQGLTYNPNTRQYALSFSEDSSEDGKAKIVIVDEKFNFVRFKILENGGHANDMAYNPNTNELLVPPIKGKTINIYNWDEDFTLKKTVTINSTSLDPIESIGYDQVNNIYAIKAVTEVIVTDTDFNVLYSHDISLPDMYISQSMEFNNGNLILWCTDRFDLNSDITNNFIVVFSVDGKLLDSYNYPSLYKYEESEGIVYIPC